MKIAVNTSCLAKDERSVESVFIGEVFQRLASHHHQEEFVFIFDEKQSNPTTLSDNVKSVVIGPAVNSFVKKILWYNVRLPQFLRKQGADVFVTPGFCSLSARVPQCLILPYLAYRHSSGHLNKRQHNLFKKNMTRAVKKAARVVVLSAYEKNLLTETYNIAADKIDVARPGSNNTYEPIANEEREQLKTLYADGFEYFIYCGEMSRANNLTNLLKAFSFFKKRQKSSMKLILASHSPRVDEAFTESLRLFRFKEEVKVLGALSKDEMARVISAAYAIIFPSFEKDSAVLLPHLLGAGIPVITTAAGPSREICEEAALYIDEKSFEDIALKMMEVFKDEELRKALSTRGKSQAENFSWDIASEAVWNSIEKANAT